MNRRTDYDRADWTLSDAELGRQLGVTKQAVAAARKARGKVPAQHGGFRHGAKGGTAMRRIGRHVRALSPADQEKVIAFAAKLSTRHGAVI